LRKNACLDHWQTTNDAFLRRSTAVLIVLVGWGYVVAMMALAEAVGPSGSVLGAIVTALLYGALPMSVIWYIGGARGRALARQRASESHRDEPPPASGDDDPGGGGQPPGDAVAPEREEP
jgi:hypothetical protein